MPIKKQENAAPVRNNFHNAAPNRGLREGEAPAELAALALQERRPPYQGIDWDNRM
jgi:hypothetical protein